MLTFGSHASGLIVKVLYRRDDGRYMASTRKGVLVKVCEDELMNISPFSSSLATPSDEDTILHYKRFGNKRMKNK